MRGAASQAFNWGINAKSSNQVSVDVTKVYMDLQPLLSFNFLGLTASWELNKTEVASRGLENVR